MSTNRALNKYKKDVLESNVANADPHRLIQMLLEGALNNIRLAKNMLAENNLSEKGEKIGRAISIIECLRSSLNHETEDNISENLESLYEYIQHCLLEANLHNDNKRFDEVIALLGEIKEAWDQIGPQVSSEPGHPSSSTIGSTGQK